MEKYLGQTDEEFKAELASSIPFVWRAARMFSDKGYDVSIPATHVRPSIDQIKEYSDGGDLFIQMPVEVKHRPELHFTSRESFPYRTIIVDHCKGWDKHKVKPFCYIIYNATASHYVVIMGSTHKQWTKVERRDTKKDRVRSFYECPIELTSFIKS